MDAIQFDDFLERIGAPESVLGIGTIRKPERVIGLRDITKVRFVSAMHKDYLKRLLAHVCLAGDRSVQPYANAEFSLIQKDPRAVKICQTFVEEKKCFALLKHFSNFLDQYHVPGGFAQLHPLLIFGDDANGEPALAHYLPPITETHGGISVILDGIHRNFIIKNTGSTVATIVVERVGAPFPCTFHAWNEIRTVDAKPADINDRFFDLKREYFRDLKFIGIDG